MNQGQGGRDQGRDAALDGDIVLIQDADMEYDPADVITTDTADRRGPRRRRLRIAALGGQPQRAYMFWHMVGKQVPRLLTNILYNTTLSDMETGYKVFRGRSFDAWSLRSDDFRIEPEITAKILKQKLRLFTRCRSAYYGRSYEEGKKITWRDGFPAVWTLFRYRVTN